MDRRRGEKILCIADERENPREVREHLDMSTFGLVTGGVRYGFYCSRD